MSEDMPRGRRSRGDGTAGAARRPFPRQGRERENTMFGKVTTAVLVMSVAATTLGGCAQVKKFRSRDEMVKAPACADFSFPVYFAEGSAQMPAAALGVIRQ